mgnify:CR=1 FL=1
MKTRNVAITLEKAKEWYNSDNASLKEIALQAFNKEELEYNFREITTFKKACEALGLSYQRNFNLVIQIATISKTSAAMYKLNIVKKALHLGQDLHLTKDPKDSHIYYPYNPFITTDSTIYNSEIKSGSMEIIGKIKNEGAIYYILGGSAYYGGYTGLGNFDTDDGVGYAMANIGLLGCASKEIAQHFSKYFGTLITKAKYGDMAGFEVCKI